MGFDPAQFDTAGTAGLPQLAIEVGALDVLSESVTRFPILQPLAGCEFCCPTVCGQREDTRAARPHAWVAEAIE
jgi:hypothetical protein